MTQEEIGRAVRSLADLGVTRVRLTGGEPLSRPDHGAVIEDICSVDSLREVSITTNGQLLERHAQALRDAGVSRVNVHVDTLRKGRFRLLGGRGDLATVLRGIEVAQRVGLKPVKINVVLMRDLNSDELIDFCEYSATTGITVRFIELMNTGPAPDFVRRHFMSAAEARERIAKVYELTPRFLKRGASPAQEFLVDGGRAAIGFIASESAPFCKGCNRLRLTAAGVLKGCLYERGGLDLLSMLRDGDCSDDRLSEQLTHALGRKRSHHVHNDATGSHTFSMAETGG